MPKALGLYLSASHEGVAADAEGADIVDAAFAAALEDRKDVVGMPCVSCIHTYIHTRIHQ